MRLEKISHLFWMSFKIIIYLYPKNKIMTEQTNGNPQLNGVRDTFNLKTSRLRLLGSTKRVVWDSKRRNRSI